MRTQSAVPMLMKNLNELLACLLSEIALDKAISFNEQDLRKTELRYPFWNSKAFTPMASVRLETTPTSGVRKS